MPLRAGTAPCVVPARRSTQHASVGFYGAAIAWLGGLRMIREFYRLLMAPGGMCALQRRAVAQCR